MSSRLAARGLITVSVMAATLMQTLDATIANVALPHMQGALGATPDQVSWVLTSYTIAAAIAMTPTGWLADRIGLKRLFLVSVAGFAIASALCGIATTLPEMVAFRLMQGLFGAALVPLSQTVLLDTYPPEEHGSAMALWGMGVTLGPILGPTLGGWLTEIYNWRWVFFINVPIAILTFIGLSTSLAPDDKTKKDRFDIMGFALLSVALLALQLLLDRGETKGWFGSNEIVVEAGIFAFTFYLFIVHQLTTAKPFLPLHLFVDRNFAAGLAMIGIVGIVLFATSALLPPFLQNLLDYPVLTTGLVVAPRGIGTMIAMRGVGRLSRHFDPRLVMLIGMVSTTISLYWMAGFTLDEPMIDIIFAGMLQGFGIGTTFVPLSTVTFATLAPDDRGYGTSLFSLFRNVGSSIGIALAFAYEAHMTTVNHAYLTEHINAFNPALSEYINASGGLDSAMGLAGLAGEVQRQAGLIALIDDFKLMAWGVLAAMPLLLLFRIDPSAPGADGELDHVVFD
ncbi:MAG TPA: DHA2 family efflux MFS transporter permease subunit [Solimonas sp.]|nr:DHA2 family efflux MFS transporter permease subunit [Solimonas sp.]